MINVTRSYLPEIEAYSAYLKILWNNRWLTNNGIFVRELEEKLKEYLHAQELLFLGNGTIALQIAIKALDITGEVITTPFSYVATTTCVLWENCTPVYADINKIDYNIDPEKIEALITSKTSAILATHVYGNPCDVEAIQSIAEKYKLKVIYDGAHAFGTKYKGKQLLTYGDLSTCSFHATKIFHTIEGGAIITNDKLLAEKLFLYRSFGHIGDEYLSIGINGKNSEFHAAMGLALLPMMPEFIKRRKEISVLYDSHLLQFPLTRPLSLPHTEYNYAYYPVSFETEEQLLKTKSHLEQNKINTRRYFYPSLNNLPYFKGEACPVSEAASLRMLALPIYYELTDEEIMMICDKIKESFA
ncbi:MAG: DegT/DnrJ/EryC1/StrS family aminotransferase [Ferruginibacter sp.]